MTTSNPNSFSAFFSQNNRETHFLCNFVQCQLGFSKGASSLQSGFKKNCVCGALLPHERMCLSKRLRKCICSKGLSQFQLIIVAMMCYSEGFEPMVILCIPIPRARPPRPARPVFSFILPFSNNSRK